MLALVITLALPAGPAATAPVPQGVTVARFTTNPLLSVQNVTRETAQNLDRPGIQPPFVSFAGPSVIRVPDWIEDAPGQYAMYFAHHKGGHIRVAFADDVRGPWTVHAPGAGVLGLEDVEGLIEDHVASPDVHVDDARRRLVMYFHGPLDGADFDQRTFVATSTNATRFEVASHEDLGEPYFRVFWHRGFAYSPGRLGPFARSRDGFTGFTTGPKLFDNRVRHYACVPWNDELYVFYSRMNEGPERIRLRTIDLADPAHPGLGRNWTEWALSAPREVLRPIEPYERQPGPRTLDPNVFFDIDGKAYLFYSGGHEQTIAGAELIIDEWQTLGIRNIRCASGAGVGLAGTEARVGAQPWLDTPATIQSLPASLVGARIVQTGIGDVRSNAAAEFFLRFEVSETATVTIAHDTATLGFPAWLGGWTATGETLNVEDPRGSLASPRILDVYERSFEPGAVAIGGNLPRDAAFPLDGVMYCVFVR
ncbi:hypothetical protein Poly30_22610 [Planctomycetes bacterium Poly30]|uniref:Glycosyl hydrolases family 43 n=1 Tax=Saltatorellus ferox TaxID=2528018 RepID=A0A518ERN3_9BACT|nr:hypothetical protein Poly30_22610 [Planctomycetes bacterium Poly30]